MMAIGDGKIRRLSRCRLACQALHLDSLTHKIQMLTTDALNPIVKEQSRTAGLERIVSIIEI